MRKLVLIGFAAVALAVLVPTAFAATSVGVTLKEFKVSPTVSSVKPGKVTFKIKNRGALDHELVVIKTNLAASKLPVKGGKVSLKSVAQAGPFGPGRGSSLTVALKAGKYVLICNVKGHYQAGQRAAFTVR
jgi:uncharacterized cupredoxin-like copper-binding protein